MDQSSKKVSKAMLKRAIHGHLVDSGFTYYRKKYFIDGELTKQRIRDFHQFKRNEILAKNRDFILTSGEELVKSIADGSQINPKAIQPELVEVKPESKESKLFRFATYLWSIPVSQGFGRRIRYLIKDKQNDKLIGIFALGDPVFNLSARDNLIGWTSEDRKSRLVNILDAYVLGALPPYSNLIGGKLVVALMGSQEVSKVFNKKYGHGSLISGSNKNAKLTIITTTSALGRSSILNRLRIPNGIQAIRIGSTKGFGHFQISDELFNLMRTYLFQIDHPYAIKNRFGDGPNWRFRVVRACLDKIGIHSNHVLKHGIKRDVYILPLMKNWKKLLLNENKNIKSLLLPSEQISEFCINRWMLPRSLRDDKYKHFKRSVIIDSLLNGGPPPRW